jgi:hypothetical protein
MAGNWQQVGGLVESGNERGGEVEIGHDEGGPHCTLRDRGVFPFTWGDCVGLDEIEVELRSKSRDKRV